MWFSGHQGWMSERKTWKVSNNLHGIFSINQTIGEGKWDTGKWSKNSECTVHFPWCHLPSTHPDRRRLPSSPPSPAHRLATTADPRTTTTTHTPVGSIPNGAVPIPLYSSETHTEAIFTSNFHQQHTCERAKTRTGESVHKKILVQYSPTPTGIAS